jgi:hypothetical protein
MRIDYVRCAFTLASDITSLSELYAPGFVGFPPGIPKG